MSGSASIMSSKAKVIALVDMDCFYVQVEERDDPKIKGIPAAVVQYKAWKGGGIIAVNYEARARGVTRNMRGDDAKAACPEIVLVRVPEVNEKANLTKYRDAGKEVLDVLCEFSNCVERASIDEAYIDLTEAVNAIILEAGGDHDPLACLDKINSSHLINNFPIGFESSDSWLMSVKSSEIVSTEDVQLAVGAGIVGHMRQAVFDKTGFRCSAGIAHNKVLAKLACGVNKPNKQTVVPRAAVPELYSQTKITKVRNLGGQFGHILVETYKCEKMSDLLQISLKQLTQDFGDERGKWIYNLARGWDDEPVTKRQLPQSIGCSKNFMGPEALATKEKVSFWIGRLCEEVVERIQTDLEVNNRRAKVLTLHVKFTGKKALSRSCGKNVYYTPDRMASGVMITMEKLYQQYGILPINNLGVIASKLESDSVKSGKIDSFYRQREAPPSSDISARSDSNLQCSSSSSAVSVPTRKTVEESAPQTSKVSVGSVCTDVQSKIANDVCNLDDDDDDVDVEKFTPDSPVPADTDADTSPDESLQESERKERTRRNSDCIPVVIDSTGEVEKTPTKVLQTIIIPENQPQKSLFFCSKSPTKIRKAVSSIKDTAASTIVSTLSKQTGQVNTKAGNSASSSKSGTHAIFDLCGSSSSDEAKNIKYSKSTIIASNSDVKILNDSDYIVGGIDTRTLSKEYLQVCDRCKRDIPLWEFASHSDFHVAFDLQEKFGGGGLFNVGCVNQNNNNINGSSSAGPSGGALSGQKRAAVGVSSSSSRGRGTSKRGRPSKSGPSKEQMNTLDSYFQPKNLS